MDAERGADGAGAVSGMIWRPMPPSAFPRRGAAERAGMPRPSSEIGAGEAWWPSAPGSVEWFTRFGDGLHCALPYRPFPSMRREHHRGLQYNMHNTANEGRGKLEKISRADEVG